MKYAIFGGTFDPFTKAHEAIVNKLLDEQLVTDVIIAPSITNWYRDKSVWLDDEQRLDLCNTVAEFIYTKRSEKRCATKDPNYRVGHVGVWWRDIHKKLSIPEGQMRDEFCKSWHFLDTLLDFRFDYDVEPNDTVYVVIGSDQLMFFKQWHRWEDILKLAKLVVVNGRAGEHVDSDIEHIDIAIAEEFKDFSATAIRAEYRNKPDGYKQYAKLFMDPPKETVLCRTPIFTLVRKPDPDGDIGFEPVGINSPDWVTVIVEKDGKFLMVKQLRYGLMKEFEEFPCGMVEKDEAPIFAAQRELLEETGIKVELQSLKKIGCFAANPAFMSNHMHYFYVNLKTDADGTPINYQLGEQHLDEHEKLKVYWKDKIDVMKEMPESKCSSLMAGALYLLERSKELDLL